MVEWQAAPARRKLMQKVRQRNTDIEVIVRKRLHYLGYRFRLHSKSLPGSPDIVMPRLKLVLFVHGCFWHGHDCRHGKLPKKNADSWAQKLTANQSRDRAKITELEEMGWTVEVIWGCEAKIPLELDKRLHQILKRADAKFRARGV